LYHELLRKVVVLTQHLKVGRMRMNGVKARGLAVVSRIAAVH
jgi:hypothetical protein